VIGGFARHVPEADIGMRAQNFGPAFFPNEVIYRMPLVRRVVAPSEPQIFRGISTARLMKMFGGVLASQLPGRHPKDYPVPDWYHDWMLSYAAGEDMAHYYGTPLTGTDG
jgi:hypothetical protein